MSNEEVSSSEGVLLKELPDQSGEQIHSNKTRESSLVIDESHLNDSTTRDDPNTSFFSDVVEKETDRRMYEEADARVCAYVDQMLSSINLSLSNLSLPLSPSVSPFSHKSPKHQKGRIDKSEYNTKKKKNKKNLKDLYLSRYEREDNESDADDDNNIQDYMTIIPPNLKRQLIVSIQIEFRDLLRRTLEAEHNEDRNQNEIKRWRNKYEEDQIQIHDLEKQLFDYKNDLEMLESKHKREKTVLKTEIEVERGLKESAEEMLTQSQLKISSMKDFHQKQLSELLERNEEEKETLKKTLLESLEEDRKKAIFEEVQKMNQEVEARKQKQIYDIMEKCEAEIKDKISKNEDKIFESLKKQEEELMGRFTSEVRKLQEQHDDEMEESKLTIKQLKNKLKSKMEKNERLKEIVRDLQNEMEYLLKLENTYATKRPINKSFDNLLIDSSKIKENDSSISTLRNSRQQLRKDNQISNQSILEHLKLDISASNEINQQIEDEMLIDLLDSVDTVTTNLKSKGLKDKANKHKIENSTSSSDIYQTNTKDRYTSVIDQIFHSTGV